MKKIFQFMLSVFLITIFSSCSKQLDTNSVDLEKGFSTEVPITDMNKSLQLAVDDRETSFTYGSKIHLVVYNKSPFTLHFDNNSDIRLLGSVDNLQWVHVKNSMTYLDPMLLSPQGTILLDTQYTLVKPILDSADPDAQNKNMLLRIVIVGEIMERNTRTGKKVGAYVDVSLKP